MGESINSRKAAFVIYFGSGLMMWVLAVLLIREAPVFFSHELSAVRAGVDLPFACNDPASCNAPGTMGQVRLPGSALDCMVGTRGTDLMCTQMIEGKSIEVIVRFEDAKRSRISGCEEVLFNGKQIPCDVIYNYPRNEVVLGEDLPFSLETVNKLRWRYPLTQLDGTQWWGIVLLTAVVMAFQFGCGLWLWADQKEKSRKWVYSLGGGVLGLIGFLNAVVVIFGALQYPID